MVDDAQGEQRFFSIHRAVFKNKADGFDNDCHVKQPRPFAQTVQVKIDADLHFFKLVSFTAQAVDLSPAGNAKATLYLTL